MRSCNRTKQKHLPLIISARKPVQFTAGQLLPVILGLQELKFIFDPIAGLCHCELEAGLPRLVWCLKSAT